MPMAALCKGKHARGSTIQGQACLGYHYAGESGSTAALGPGEHVLCKGKHGNHGWWGGGGGMSVLAMHGPCKPVAM